MKINRFNDVINVQLVTMHFAINVLQYYFNLRLTGYNITLIKL